VNCLFFFSSRRRHTRFSRDWSSDVCSSDLVGEFQLTDVLAPLSEQGYSILISHRGRTAPLEGPTSFASILSELGFEGSSLEESEIGRASCRERVWLTIKEVSPEVKNTEQIS